MLIILIATLCLTRDLLPGAVALLADIEPDATILALSVFVFLACRVWLGEADGKLRAQAKK
jgi:hypothetical protein